ncbi:isochorismatase family protein [Ramlibacter sp. WS9]|uniref:isochorismatase family protein n=1 Tax=Ramlibacter sp. WS9 TaxID=1882741 RepID=UPI001144C021|nr:isochorismatase family protein [Ramlibacter sp. WS9]ROZ72495.1 isochorismatase family protein [Ramlibacter sp. WS9]
MLLDADESQLVLVDYQSALMPSIHEGEAVLRNALRLGRLARMFDVPAWGTEENPQGLGSSPPELRELCRKTLTKMHFSAVADGLTELLRPPAKARQGGNARSLPKHLQKPAPEPEEQRNTVVIAGCEAHVCLLQTALDLLEEEFEVWVVTDACSSRTERDRDAAFDRLAGAGAELVTTEMVAFEWLRTAEHPLFKDVLSLVK